MNEGAAINRSVQNGDTVEVNDSPIPAKLKSHCEVEHEVRAWLDRFAAAVRDVDYEMGRQLFASNVVGCGTVGVMLEGLDALLAGQWKKIWPVTSGFHFHAEHLTCGGSGDVAWAAVPWTSWGGHRDGQSFERHGRATYILHR